MNDSSFVDTLILGAGPAGLQLGYFLHKAERDYLIVDGAQKPGAFFEKFPRHRTLLSINKQHTLRSATDFNLRHDWNCLLTYPGEEMFFKEFSPEYFPPADRLVDYLECFRERFGLKVRFGARASRIKRDNNRGSFTVYLDCDARISCRRLVIATGLTKPHIPPIKGIEHAVGYEDASIEPEDYEDKTVLIVGKGNSALETAQHLMPFASFIHLSSRHPVRFAWDSHFVGHVRSVNSVFFDSYLLKSQNAVLDGHTLEIVPSESGKLKVRWSATHQDVEEEIEEFYYDVVIRCTGFEFDADMFDPTCKPDLVVEGRLPGMTGSWESTEVKGLFFAGVLMQSIDYKRSQSAFIHGFRYNVRTLFHILEQDFGVELPSDPVELTAEAVTKKVIERSNGCSALWQQVGFLCDVLVLREDGRSVGRWYYDLNTRYVEETFGSDPACEYYVSMLVYGPEARLEGYTAFDHPHVHPHKSDYSLGDWTTEIHPVLRRFRGTRLQIEYHVKSDVLTEWSSELYTKPLQEFLAWDLEGGELPKWVKPRRRELMRDGQMRASGFISEGVADNSPPPAPSLPRERRLSGIQGLAGGVGKDSAEKR